MDITHIVTFVLGAAAYAALVDYTLPWLKHRHAVKARIAKATATRKANAVRKAAGGQS